MAIIGAMNKERLALKSATIENIIPIMVSINRADGTWVEYLLDDLKDIIGGRVILDVAAKEELFDSLIGDLIMKGEASLAEAKANEFYHGIEIRHIMTRAKK